MSEIYSPSGNVGVANIKRATVLEAATGTHGQEFMRDNISRILDRIRYMRDNGGYASPGGSLISPKDPPYNAVGDGSANDTTPLASALSDASGKRLILPATAGYLTTAPLSVPAKTMLVGDGRGSPIKTTTVSTHLILVATPGAVLRALSLQGVKGSSVLNNSAALFDTATDGLIEDCEAFGMSGDALFVTDGASRIRLFKNYVHGLTADASMINSADMALYSDASYCMAAFNQLAGGAQTEVGIILQLNSRKHLVIGNEIAAHYSYGIMDYDTVPRHTNNIIVVNRIEDIDGSGGGNTKGAGIYVVGTGGQVIALNQISNTNINTTTETLVPAGVGINGAFSPIYVGGNMIWNPNWYGLKVAASVAAIVELANNHIFESLKMAIYVHSSSHVSISGGSITMLTATPLTQRAIGINVAGGGLFKNVSVKGVHIRGGSIGIDANVTDKLLLAQNTISEVGGAGGGIRVIGGDGALVADNNVDVTTAATAPALSISNMTNSTFKGNVLKSTSTTCVVCTGANTGSVFDLSNVLVGMDMNNVDNQSAGCRFEVYGSGPPTVKNHQVGDVVVNRSPTPGAPIKWECTSAGVPGTWRPIWGSGVRFLLSDVATVNVDAAVGDYFTLSASGNRTIAAPTNPTDGKTITFEILNSTGGAMTTTWNAIYAMPAWTDPATGKRRTAQFTYNSALVKWVIVGTQSGDI